MGELLSDPNPARAQAAMQAMLQMQKIEVKVLEEAADAAA
jgi:predicted 3-demethylubiquinone-9 3-methyltransferase (glyoxalase superfamily)